MSKDKGTTPKNGELIFGKFTSMEEAAKGYQAQIDELNKRGQQNTLLTNQVNSSDQTNKALTDLLERQNTSAVAPSVERVNIQDSDGDMTPETVAAFIESRIAPIQQSVGELPNTVRQTMQEFMQPAIAQNEARNTFFGQDSANQDRVKFGQELPTFSMQNPGINKTFEMLSSNPETANQAYEYMYDMWKAKQPSATTAIDEGAKANMGLIPSTPGPPATLPGESIDSQELIKMGLAAGESMNPQAKNTFFSQWMKGTRLEKQFEDQKQDLISRGQLPGE